MGCESAIRRPGRDAGDAITALSADHANDDLDLIDLQIITWNVRQRNSANKSVVKPSWRGD